MTEEEKKLYRNLRMPWIIIKIILVLLIIIYALLFQTGCNKQEKAPAPAPVAMQQTTQSQPLPAVSVDEHPIKLSDEFRLLAQAYNARVDSTYAVFNNWQEVREDLVSWSIAYKKMLYELVLPDGRTYAIPESFHGEYMVVFDDRALAEKFVADSKLTVEKGVSIKALVSGAEDE